MAEEETTTEPALVEEEKASEAPSSEGDKEPETSKSDDKTSSKEAVTSEDSGDESTVLVDHKDAEEQPHALQIVSIGTEEDGKLDQVEYFSRQQ